MKYTVHITRTDSVNVEIEADTKEQAEEIATERFAAGEIEFPFAYIFDNVEITAEPAAKEPTKPAPVVFTPEELSMLSDALTLAIRENSEAMKQIIHRKVKAALEANLDELRDLNSKICLATGEALLARFHVWEEKRTPPRVVIHVEEGIVQAVYANADVDVEVCDLDTEDQRAYRARKSALDNAANDGAYKAVY